MNLGHSFSLRVICGASRKTLPSLWATNECDIELLKYAMSTGKLNSTVNTHAHENWVKKYG